MNTASILLNLRGCRFGSFQESTTSVLGAQAPSRRRRVPMFGRDSIRMMQLLRVAECEMDDGPRYAGAAPAETVNSYRNGSGQWVLPAERVLGAHRVGELIQ